MNSVFGDKENELDGAVFCNLESESHFMEALRSVHDAKSMEKAHITFEDPYQGGTSIPSISEIMSTPLESVLLHPDVVQGQASNGRMC